MTSESLLEFFSTNNLEIVNKSHKPKFMDRISRQDLTLATPFTSNKIKMVRLAKRWSGHAQIRFDVESKHKITEWRRVPELTNWKIIDNV